MRLLPESEDRSPEVNVVPLIDVIFAILTFFVVTSLTLSRTEGLSVNLPSASSGKTQDQTKVVITINAEGEIYMNRNPTNTTTLVPQIESLMVKDLPTMIIINADEKVAHGRVVTVMDLVQKIPGIKLGIATKRN